MEVVAAVVVVGLAAGEPVVALVVGAGAVVAVVLDVGAVLCLYAKTLLL